MDLLSRAVDAAGRAGDLVGVAGLGGTGIVAGHTLRETHDHTVDGAEPGVVDRRRIGLQANDDAGDGLADGDGELAVCRRALHRATDVQGFAADGYLWRGGPGGGGAPPHPPTPHRRRW